MNRYISDRSNKGLRILIGVLLWAMVLCAWPASAAGDAGLDLNLYTRDILDDENKPTGRPTLKFKLGDPIELWIVISNKSAWDVNTDPEIQDVELDRYIVLRDPSGEKHTLNLEASIDDMPPPITYSEYQVVPAKALKPGYVRSVYIEDLTKLFPDLKQFVGAYELSVSLPVSRYGWTVKVKNKLHGVLDGKAWHGNLESKPITIYVRPEWGGRPRVRVVDLNDEMDRYHAHIPVKVFTLEEINTYGLDGAWDKVRPILEGETDDSGWAVWPPGTSCVVEPGESDAYVAVANFQGKLREVYFDPGETEGWQAGCSGLIEKEIFYNEPEPDPEPKYFSILALNSVHIEKKAHIWSGDVGVNELCTQCLIKDNRNFDVVIEERVRIGKRSKVVGDKIYIDKFASVWDVDSNDVENVGKIRGTITPLDTTNPVWDDLPVFQTGTPDEGQPINLESHGYSNPDPGRYGDVTLGGHARLELKNGDYDFQSVTLGTHAKIVCNASGDQRVNIRIKETLVSNNAKAYIGPKVFEGNAKNIVIYIEGRGQAATLGEGNVLRANLYARNGSVTTGNCCLIVGSVIARDITIGHRNNVIYNSAFATEPPGIQITDTSVYKSGKKYKAVLEWTNSMNSYVSIYRDGNLRTWTYNDEYHVDNLGKRPKDSYEYQICDLTSCSEITVTVDR